MKLVCLLCIYFDINFLVVCLHDLLRNVVAYNAAAAAAAAATAAASGSNAATAGSNAAAAG